MNGGVQARPLLSVRNLRVGLPSGRGLVRAVDGISLDLYAGQTLALVGESGCGKSMLCRTIMGLAPASAVISPESSIVFNGRPLIGLPEKKFNRIRGREMAMVFQNPMTSLNPVMKVGKQIAEPLIRHLGLTRKQAGEKALDLLKMVGVPDPGHRLDQYPHQLSGGLRQRAALAVALSCQPKLLVADEPTTALDVTVQAEILDMLAELRAETDLALILVTHDLQIAAGRADEAAVMYAGGIVEKAGAEILFNHMLMPYTRALIEAAPKIDDRPHTRLNAIEGRPPDLIDPQEGCRFSPRCRYTRKKCLEAAPPLNPASDPEHLYACWHPLGSDGEDIQT